jgi:hypothetical protein
MGLVGLFDVVCYKHVAPLGLAATAAAERARSGRFNYIIMQVLKPSPLWYLNYRVLTSVCCRGLWVWPTPWLLVPHTETPSDAQKFVHERQERSSCGDLGLWIGVGSGGAFQRQAGKAPLFSSPNSPSRPKSMLPVVSEILRLMPQRLHITFIT